MKVHFWGVRGSTAAPITSQQIQAKITAIIQKITVKDLETPDARERFIASLPQWQFGTTGGNTPCVTIIGSDNTKLILDAGTGLRCYGKKINKTETKEFNMFFSHFHWDHIQGIPFFDPIYNKDTVINIFSSDENAKNYLQTQMGRPFFPVNYEDLPCKINYYQLKEGLENKIGNFTVSLCKMFHPGDSYSYSFTENDKKIVYATDVELTQNDFEVTKPRQLVFENADVMIIDSQYTVEEANKKVNWGHSAFCNVIDFAVHWKIKKIYLFHHEPTYDDKKLNAILQSARWYAKYIAHSNLQIYLSTENTEFSL